MLLAYLDGELPNGQMSAIPIYWFAGNADLHSQIWKLWRKPYRSYFPRVRRLTSIGQFGPRKNSCDGELRLKAAGDPSSAARFLNY
jgi:hypothetical protein